MPPAALRFLSDWLKDKMLPGLYEFAGIYPISRGGTARASAASPTEAAAKTNCQIPIYRRRNDTGRVMA